MLKYLATKEKGFTLMELLIAVAIVAVLAGVGIPIYMKLQGGAKATEANANLDGIRTSLEAYKMVNNQYISAVSAPRAVADLDTDGHLQEAWDPAVVKPGFDDIGFAPNAGLRFVYAIACWNGAPQASDPTEYFAGAVGNTNSDLTQILYVASQAHGPRIINAADTDAVNAVAALNNAVAFGAGSVLITDTTD